MALHRHTEHDTARDFAYVAYELTSQVAAWAIDPKSGAIHGPPLSIVNAMSGCEEPFLGKPGGLQDSANEAAHAAQMQKDQKYSKLVEPGGVCSDKATSLAAARVAPSGSHLVVSCRIVGAPGAVSAIPLDTTDGRLVDRMVSLTSTLGSVPRDFAFLNDTRSTPGESRKRGVRKPCLPAAAPTGHPCFCR